MNGSAARKLRKLIASELAHLPTIKYADKTHQKLLPNGVNADGTTKYVAVELYTRKLEACQRYLYQRAKRIHHTYPHN